MLFLSHVYLICPSFHQYVITKHQSIAYKQISA